MDDANRAELSALRRRAFGPAPDIADDSAALDRLAVLEALAHAGDTASVASVDSAGHAGAPREREFAGDGMPQPAAHAIPRRSPRRQDGATLAIAAALVAGAVVVSSAPTPRAPAKTEAVAAPMLSQYSAAVDGGAEQLFEIPVGGWYGIQMTTPDPDEIPPFPTSGPTLWATSLGEYYGWELWIGGAAGTLQAEQCLVLVHGGVTRGRCVPEATRPDGRLVASLTYRHIAPDERPEALGAVQRIDFWWARDDVVSIMLATSTP